MLAQADSFIRTSIHSSYIRPSWISKVKKLSSVQSSNLNNGNADVLESNQKITTNYGADQITVLEGLEPVRKRPGM